MKTKIGVIIYTYLKHSPDYIDSKYIWIHGSNYLGSSVFAEISFFLFFVVAFLDLRRERRRCGQVGPILCYSENEVVYKYQVLNL